MTEIWNGFIRAIELIISLDPQVMEIAGRSLMISATSALLASLICLPLGGLIHFHNFPGNRLWINIIQTFFSLPTVAVGLFVFVLFSRAGPHGGTNQFVTPTCSVIRRMLRIVPRLLVLTLSAVSGVARAILDTALSLGASGFQTVIVILREARYAVVAAIIMGFGRAISEVGLAIMVGGNIKGFTRVITTAISLEIAKGELELSIAVGIILVSIALIINMALNRIQQR